MFIDKLVNIFSIITLSGFSSFAERLVSMLKFPQALASFSMSECIAWVITIILLIGAKNIIICCKDLGRSFVKKLHPNAVVSIKLKGKNLIDSEIDYASTHFVTMLALQLLLVCILSFEVQRVSDLFVLSAAIIGNSGWVLLLFGKTALLAGFSPVMKAIICLCFIPRRILLILKIARRIRSRRQIHK